MAGEKLRPDFWTIARRPRPGRWLRFAGNVIPVDLDDSHMIVASDRVVTAGAAMGHLDLALWLLRQASPELATLVAGFMLVDKRSSQARYVIPDHRVHADPVIAGFERWARDNLSRGFSLLEAANALSIGPRTLRRRTENEWSMPNLFSR
jgi:transcriptional regulator GlxA family with amidase domain